MGRPLSNDLRERIVEAHQRKGLSYTEIAAALTVGYATVSRILRRFRERRSIEPDGRAGGNPPRINADELPVLRDIVAEQPDRTVEQIRDEWVARSGVDMSRSSMQRALHRAGLRRKKNVSKRPSKPPKE